MASLNEKIHKFYSDKYLYRLFTLWLITFLFGAKICAYSFSFFTIYPNFIMNILFIPLILKKITSLQRTFKAYSLILLLFLFYSFIWLALNVKNQESIFAIRSHISNLLSFLIIVTSYLNFNNKNLFEKAIKTCIWLWLILIVTFGLFEILTGFHFEGHYTKSIVNTVSKMIDFSPIFIFDNPNDYAFNCIGLFLILLFVDRDKLKNNWVIISILLIFLIIAIYTSSRISGYAILLLLLIILLRFYLFLIIKKINENKNIFILVTTCFIILIYSNKLFLGKDYTNINCLIAENSIFEKINGKYYPINQFKKITENEKKELYNYINKKNKNPGFNSTDIRLKLFKNGLNLIKENPILGVGPGQFSVLNKNKKVPYDTGENFSPHNFFIEIISQYGLIAIVYLIFILTLIVNLIKNKMKNYFWLLISIIVFYILSFSPSAFMYQPIYWLFMSLWIIYYQIEREKYFAK